MTDELPSMRLEGEVSMSNEPIQLPVIPIQPNSTIPVTIGLLLILFGLLIAFEGYAQLEYQGAANMDESYAEDIVDAINQNPDSNITVEDYQDFHDDLRHNYYYFAYAWGGMIGGILLFAGGVQLMRKQRIGVNLALGGNGILLITAIYLGTQSSGYGIMSFSYQLTAGVCGICSMMCGLISALPILHKAGKAALEGEPVTKVYGFIQEEE